MRPTKRFHEGELTAQRRADPAQAVRMSSAGIRERIPGGALGFIEQQPMAVIGSLDDAGRVWASALFGAPGFLSAQDDRTLILDRSLCHSAGGDPLWDNLGRHPRTGLLVIDLTTRRRLRVNGSVRRSPGGPYRIEVERAYPNCPKYIQRRRWEIIEAEASGAAAPGRQGARLSAGQQAWIRLADTFFVASAHPDQGLDASHRGGRPGFVEVPGPHRLCIPDFAGNGMFNTLGNFVSYPHAGLVFIDFEGGRVLQLTGRAEILWNGDDPHGQTGGTRRFWEFEVEAWREGGLRSRLEWKLVDYSPFLPNTGASGGDASAE